MATRLVILAGLLLMPSAMTVVFLWRTYGLDLVGDYVRRYVRRLRAWLDLPTIEQSPTRGQRTRRR